MMLSNNIAAKNLTKDASTIISNTLQRDDYRANDDIIGVVFDSFNDNENGLTFFTNPEGVESILLLAMTVILVLVWMRLMAAGILLGC